MHIYCECSFSDVVNMQRNDFCGLNNQLAFILLTMMLNRRLYFTRVKLGNPAKEFYVQIDTGSDILWVTCSSCTGCPTSSGLNVRPAVPQSPQDDIILDDFRQFCWFYLIMNLEDLSLMVPYHFGASQRKIIADLVISFFADPTGVLWSW